MVVEWLIPFCNGIIVNIVLDRTCIVSDSFLDKSVLTSLHLRQSILYYLNLVVYATTNSLLTVASYSPVSCIKTVPICRSCQLPGGLDM